MKIKEKNALGISAAVGIVLLPILFRKPGFKIWSVIHITNAASSHLMDQFLVNRKRLRYPVRLLPNVFKINIVYDYLFCPLITIIYCQTSYNSPPLNTIIQGFLYGIPQVVLEYIAERKSRIIKYSGGWTWVHSYIGIVVVKLAFRGLFELIRPKKQTI